VAEQIIRSKATLGDNDMPDIDIGKHCSSPYACDFIGYCWKHIPDYSVFNLTNARGKQWELYKQDILKLKDIPEGMELNRAQSLQVDGERSGAVHIDQDGISAFLADLDYPLYFLDFESIQPGVPIYDQSSPYQQICFQYSLHIQQEPRGETEHIEFLADVHGGDPRKAMLERMIPELGSAGSIIVYHQSFEASRLREMARDIPEYAAAIEPILERLIDLAIPFKNKHYYTPEMLGRWSIKNVLPALVPELSYDNLEIHDGGTASSIFMQMVLETFDGDVTKTRADLLAYCELDTLAMVKMVGVLEGVV